MIKYKKSLAVAVIVVSPLLTPTISPAAPIEYDGFQISYSRASLDAPPVDDFTLEGFDIEVMYSFSRNIVIGGQYADGSGDSSALLGGRRLPVKIDASGPSVFAFYHAELQPGTEYQIGGSYSKIDTDVTSNGRPVDALSVDDDSKYLIGGLRHQLTDKIEAGLQLSYDFDADDDEFSYAIVGRYKVLEEVDVAATFEPDSDGDVFTVSVKKYFDFGNR